MESDRLTVDHLLRWAAQPRVRGFAIAIVALAILVILQVNQQRQETPMCELLNDCRLQSSDLQRLQIAFTEQGLDQFQIEGHTMLVPQERHADYMRAATEAAAIPSDLRESDDEPVLSSFLMSGSMRKSAELKRKTQQIRDMVVRLPFVEQAWFDMDIAETGNAFERPNRSAVVSIRSPMDVALSEQQIDTVRQMISGAVADLRCDDIVVIDLENGFAHQSATDPLMRRQLERQQIAFRQQQSCEQRLSDLQEQFPGLQWKVQVSIIDPPAASPKPSVSPASTGNAVRRRSVLPPPGANGTITLNTPAPTPSPISPPPAAAQQHVLVSIGVPETTLAKLVPRTRTKTDGPVSAAVLAADQNARFSRLKQQLEERVLQLFPREANRDRTHRVAVSLVRTPAPAIAKSPWWGTLREQIDRHWPSLAVLTIGIGLLTLVTRSPRNIAEPTAIQENLDHDVLSINAVAEDNSEVESTATLQPRSEAQLTQLIDDDPEAAARIIESWIRDAA